MKPQVVGRIAFLVLLSSCSPLGAHEIGTTRVSATIGERRYLIELVLDPAPLLAKLEARAGRPRSAALPAAAYQARIEALQALFLEQVLLRFDEVAVTPQFESIRVRRNTAAAFADELGGMEATVRLTGDVPAASHTITWRYGLTFASYAFTVGLDGQSVGTTTWIAGDEVTPAFVIDTIPRRQSRVQTALTYFGLGFRHIVPNGVDHILFVLGIFLFSRRVRPMLAQISAFTVAHSITLGLAVYGVLKLPPSVVEPLIALSIVYVAVENLLTSDLKPWRIALVFAFGLLHGMGFAGALGDLALPRWEFLTGLVTFNAGVEAGQLTVIAVASVALTGWFGSREWYRRRIVIPGSAGIALVALYWTVQRLNLLG